MEYTMLFWLFGLCSSEVQATTHWLVTETGLIQPRVDSPFEMARPYDLLAFLNQDTRWDNIQKFYTDLSKRQIDINKLWTELQEDTDINTWLTKDKNCRKMGDFKNLNWFAARLEDGLSTHIPQEDYQLYTPSFGEDVDVPDCKKISSLTFSMFTFEHLEAMGNRDNLSVTAELSLPELIAPLMTVDQFGHWVASVLRKNSSSWLHYNMASLYWRVRGNAPKALECSRRAVHYAPREYKHIALLSMGTVLHRAMRPEDASIVLGAAVDHDPQCIEAHFVLAHAYAMLNDFNSSMKHYDETLKLDSGYEQAVLNRYGLFCIQELAKKMKVVHKKLNYLREELREYDSRESYWIRSQSAFLRTMKLNEEIEYTQMEKIVAIMSDVTGLNIKDLKKQGDKSSMIEYFLNGPLYDEKWFEEEGLLTVETAYSVQKLIQHIRKNVEMAPDIVTKHDQMSYPDGKIKKEIGPLPAMPELDLAKSSDGTKIESQPASKPDDKPNNEEEDDTYEYELALPLYPNTLRVSRNVEDFDREPGWPSDKLCKASAVTTNNLEIIYPVFLPFENKGLRLRGLLTDRIGVGINSEHELPWHPPMCPAAREAATIMKKAQKLQMLPELAHSEYLRQKLLEYVSDGDVDQVKHMQYAEIGQRIYSSMLSKSSPKWLSLTIASLYWRVRGNNVHALNCIIAALRHVRIKYKDVVLTSLASVYLEMGYFDEALLAAEESFKLGMYEPATNFLLYQLSMIKKQRNTQMFHLKQTVRLDVTFLHGTARHLLMSWGCMLKTVDTMQSFEFSDGDVCTQMEPGVSLICNKGNQNCQIANVQCFMHSEKESTSTLVRLSEQAEALDLSVLEPFIKRMPLERGDMEGHAAKLDELVAAIDQLRGCGPKGCRNITPEDLGLKEDVCAFQFMQLGYWIGIISFRQLLSEYDLRLPPEIMALPPSAKKIPECRMYADPSQDFILERLSRLQPEGWEPVMFLMHHFADLHQEMEYNTLGAKYARYVETRARSWAGALGAGWWCGAGGRGACALRCLSAAYALAPQHQRVHALRSLAALLHMQSRHQDATDIAHLTLYLSPKSNTEAFIAAVSHTYRKRYEQAIWMYRYALSFDPNYLPAKACLHATICIMLFGEKTKPVDLREEL